MPTYDFIDTKTGEEWTDMMSISEKESYLKKNKHIKQGIGKINIVSGIGGVKTDGGWKDMLNRIGNAHPGSKVHDLYGDKNSKDIKTKQVIQKHQKIQKEKRKKYGK